MLSPVPESEKIEIKSDDVNEDCFPCKMIGATSLLIASAYVFTRGLKARLLSTKAITVIFGSSLGYTGMARFLDWYPFNRSSKLHHPFQK